MGWSLGFDDKWKRDIGYGVPAYCDRPGCWKEIDRGLAYVCGSEPYGGEHGCGLFFCADHRSIREPRGAHRCVENCHRCMTYKPPYRATPDHPEWIDWKLTDDSWSEWRADNPEEVERLRAASLAEALI